MHASHPKATIQTSLPLTSPISQIDGLQVLRAIAVLLVAWLHAGEMFLYPGAYVFPSLGVFGIDIFFVISGFIMATVVTRASGPPGPSASWEFLKRRLIRIFPIYWIVCVIVMLRLLAGHRLFQANYLPAFFLLPSPDYPNFAFLVAFSWTLVFEMFFYYVLAILLLFTRRMAVPLAMAFLITATLIGHFAGIQRPVWIVLCNPMLLEFVGGCCIAMAFPHVGKHRRTGLAMVIAGFAAAAWLQAYAPTSFVGMFEILTGGAIFSRVATFGLAACLIVAGVALSSRPTRTAPGRFALLLGNASYSTYLLSGLIIEYFARLLLRLSHQTLPLSAGMLLLFDLLILALVFVTGWACYQFVEWPLLRSLQRRWTAHRP